MKKVFAGILALGTLAFAGCGPTAEDVIGTWTYAEGSTLKMACTGDFNFDTDLGGTTMTWAAGTTADLITDGGECDTAWTFDGGELRATGTEGTCEETEGGEEDGTVEGELYFSYAMDGDVATLTAMGTMTTTTTAYDGSDFVCTFSYSEGSKLTK